MSSPADVAFLLFFVLYTAGSVLWLVMGLVPVLAHIFLGVADVQREGLQAMIDRLEVLGGHLDVQSAPGRGTTVTGRIPV